MNNPEIIFFDLDETLIVNQQDVEATLTEVFRNIVKNPSIEQQSIFKRSVFSGAETLWSTMFEHQNDHSALKPLFADAFAQLGCSAKEVSDASKQFIESASKNTRLSENAQSTLNAIRRKDIRIGMITNGFVGLQSSKIHQHSLLDWIDVPVISQQTGAHKPHRQVFDYALDQAGTIAERAWHVGDHPRNDVAGARAAGMTAILYDPEQQHSTESLREKDILPHHTISNLKELLLLL